MSRPTLSRRDRLVTFATEYADQKKPVQPPAPLSDEEHAELLIPGDLSGISDEELQSLHEQAVAEFDGLYGDGTGLNADDIAALGQLTEGIESILAELQSRDAAQSERNDLAQAMAQRVGLKTEVEAEDESAAVVEVEDDEEDDEEEGAAEAVTASAPDPTPAPAPVPAKDIRVNLSGMRSTRRMPTPSSNPRKMEDVVFAAADVKGFTAGQGLDWTGLGKIVDRRLSSFNASQYAAAHDAGRHMREQHSVAVIHKPIDEKLMLRSSDPAHTDEVLQYARSEKRLEGGSLVAAGGWCAPSEVLYDLFELESRDGLVSVPEIGVSRGGINFTPGPDFATIYAAASFWHATEAQDIAGDYDPGAGTAKACYKVPCPSFTDKRMEIDGICITAGLLQQRGYPEVIARTVRGALTAHQHRMAANTLTAMVSGSTAITMTAAQAGAVAPLLDSIELQVEHYRYIHRMPRSGSLEAIFPYWVHGVMRSDLARRLGVELLDVPDSRIDGWFRSRGVSPQFVYNWQDITGASTSWKAWPATVAFLLYASGTWVKGTADILTLDTIYDTQMLAQNDFTALWTEEASLVAKLGHDSRVITTALAATGETNSGTQILATGVSGTKPT